MQSEFIKRIVNSINENASKIAIYDRDGSRCCTYGDFYVLSRRVASYIKKNGIAPGSYVGILLPKSIEFLAAELGIWFAGCASVPLGISYPQERIEYIKKNCDSPLIITSDMWGEIIDYEPMDICISQAEDDAFIIYTSGSTGNPKGVLHTFATMDELTSKSIAGSIPMENLSYASAAPFTFALSFRVWNILVTGNVLHILSDDVVKSTNMLEEYLEKYEISIATISPAVLKIFHSRSPKLKYVFGGGEKFTTQYSKDGYELWSDYGQSETVYSIANYKLPDHPMDKVPLGMCREGLQYRIIDEDGNDVEKGNTGELILKGKFFREYFKQPDITEETIMDGWLHTKDLVYENENGELQYVNRKDWMIKINGQRVEPGEVEGVMRDVPGILDAVVKDFTREDGSVYLCGYYIADKDITLSEMKDNLKKRLNSYMIPSFFVRVDEFPRLPNGKLNRKALKEPDITFMSGEYVAPENELEEKICLAMSRALNIERLSAVADFFEMGCDSVRCMKFSAIMKEEYGIEIATKEIYKYPTAQKLSDAIEKMDALQEDVYDPEAIHQDQYPLPYQIYYLDYQLYSPWKLLANVIMYLEMDRKEVDANEFQEALNKVLHHFAIFGTVFTYNDDLELVMRYRPELIENVEVVETTQSELDERYKPEFVDRFKIINNLLYKAKIYATEDKVYLYLAFHHAIGDGHFQSEMLRNIFDCMKGKELKRDLYYSYLQKVHLEQIGDTTKEDIQYLNSAYGQKKSVDRFPTPDFESRDNSNMACVVSLNHTFGEIERRAEEKGVTINAALIAAGLLVISRYNNCKCAGVEWVYSGRDEAWKEELIGITMAANAVIIDFDEIKGTDALLEEVKRQISIGIRYSAYSYAVRDVSPGQREYMKMIYEQGVDAPDNIPSSAVMQMDFDRLESSLTMFQCLLFPTAENEKPIIRGVCNGSRYTQESCEKICRMVADAFEECLFERG